MTFLLKKMLIQLNYTLCVINLLRISTVHDLKVNFDSKNYYNGHIPFSRSIALVKLDFSNALVESLKMNLH